VTGTQAYTRLWHIACYATNPANSDTADAGLWEAISAGGEPQGAKGRTARFSLKRAQPPRAHPDHGEGDRGDERLQMRICEPNIAGPAQATAPDPLGVRAFDPGPPGVLGGERGGLLPLPRGVDGLMVGLQPDGELARRRSRGGARLTGGTGTTRGPVKPDANHGITRDIPSRPPVAEPCM
jgi:hypothetical protein